MLLLNASGCLDALTAPEVARSLDAFVTKTITPEPREGNAPVRIAETDAGMLNAIGLANPGRDRFLAETLPRLRRLGVPLWVSVGGFAAREYAETCAALEDVAAIELNLSCPNVDEAPESAAAIVAACREATRLPLYAKLSPAAWDIADAARAVEAAGRRRPLAREHAPGPRTRPADVAPRLARGTGGYSGPALKPSRSPRSTPAPARRRDPDRRHGRSPTGPDALELIAAGASAVALGTVLFGDPDAPVRVSAELAAEVAARARTSSGRARSRAFLPVNDVSRSDNRMQKVPGNRPKATACTESARR